MESVKNLPVGSVFRQFKSGKLYLKTGQSSQEEAILNDAGNRWIGNGIERLSDPDEPVTVIHESQPEER